MASQYPSGYPPGSVPVHNPPAQTPTAIPGPVPVATPAQNPTPQQRFETETSQGDPQGRSSFGQSVSSFLNKIDNEIMSAFGGGHSAGKPSFSL